MIVNQLKALERYVRKTRWPTASADIAWSFVQVATFWVTGSNFRQ